MGVHQLTLDEAVGTRTAHVDELAVALAERAEAMSETLRSIETSLPIHYRLQLDEQLTAMLGEIGKIERISTRLRL